MPSTLCIESITIPAAPLGPENPLPNLTHSSAIHTTIEWDDTISKEESRYIGYGKIASILPYTLQDSYTRERRPTTFVAAVLENDVLRAVFLPELGGRLWSLYHKRADRELLYVNPVIQPGNLALRNAWFSGGVEWNVGMKGHTPFTCTPLFTETVQLPDGTPVLRMYEWERKRQCTYQIEAYLPEETEFLHVRVRIVNNQDCEIPMYWWSNIAVPETPRTRVLTPAAEGFFCRYRSGNYQLSKMPLPYRNGVDLSYATNVTNVMDMFYDVSKAPRKWLATLHDDGAGLLHLSTDRLRGRKLFAWGMSQGGRHWQDFLSVPGAPYIEVQAGLTPTQLECLPMPARAEWEWEEAYGLAECDSATVHGTDYPAAIAAVAQTADALYPQDALQAEFDYRREQLAEATGTLVMQGSGWGALENRRRTKAGEPAITPGLRFPDSSLTGEQSPWLTLLESGRLGDGEGGETLSFMVQPEWRDLLEGALSNADADNWRAWYQAGIMRHSGGELESARAAWQRSLELKATPWAVRNLALMAVAEGQLQDAAELYLRALKLSPEDCHLLIECAATLLAAGRPEEWLAIFTELPTPLANHGRIRYFTAKAYVVLKQFTAAEKILLEPLVINDMREGEISLSNLWFDLVKGRRVQELGRELSDSEVSELHRIHPLPRELDFRMNVD